MANQSIFGNQVERLLRTQWTDPQSLAEELFAIMSAPAPTQQTTQVAGPNPTSPIQIPGYTPPNSNPANFGDNSYSPSFTVNYPAGVSGSNSQQFPSTVINGGTIFNGPVTFIDGNLPNILLPNGQLTPFSSSSGGGGSSGGGAALAQVTSGTGDSYQCNIFANGSTAAATQTGVRVTIAQIDPSETLPAGTWLTACPIANGGWEATVPVWLDSGA